MTSLTQFISCYFSTIKIQRNKNASDVRIHILLNLFLFQSLILASSGSKTTESLAKEQIKYSESSNYTQGENTNHLDYESNPNHGAHNEQPKEGIFNEQANDDTSGGCQSRPLDKGNSKTMYDFYSESKSYYDPDRKYSSSTRKNKFAFVSRLKENEYEDDKINLSEGKDIGEKSTKLEESNSDIDSILTKEEESSEKFKLLKDLNLATVENENDENLQKEELKKPKTGEKTCKRKHDQHTELTAKVDEIVKIYCFNFLEDIRASFNNFEFKTNYGKTTSSLKTNYNFESFTGVYGVFLYFLESEHFDTFYNEGNLGYLKDLFDDYVQIAENNLNFYVYLFGQILPVKKLLVGKNHRIQNEIDEFLTESKMIIEESAQKLHNSKHMLKNTYEKFKKYREEIFSDISEYDDPKNELKKQLKSFCQKKSNIAFDFRTMDNTLYQSFKAFESKLRKDYLNNNLFWWFYNLKELFGNSENLFIMFSFETNLDLFKNIFVNKLEAFLDENDVNVIDNFFDVYLNTLKKINDNVDSFKKRILQCNNDKEKFVEMEEDYINLLIYIALENYNFIFFFKACNASFLNIFVQFMKNKVEENKFRSNLSKGTAEKEIGTEQGKTSKSFFCENFLLERESMHSDIKNKACDKFCLDDVLVKRIENYLSKANIMIEKIESDVKSYLIDVFIERKENDKRIEEIKCNFFQKYNEKNEKMCAEFQKII